MELFPRIHHECSLGKKLEQTTGEAKKRTIRGKYGNLANLIVLRSFLASSP